MNSEIRMNVSSFVRKDGEKAIYVLFTDGDKEAVSPAGAFLTPPSRIPLTARGRTSPAENAG